MKQSEQQRSIPDIVVLRVFTGETEIEQEAFVKDRIVLGRDPYTDVYLEDPMVSRLHASISRQDRKLLFNDHSSNGTVVNGKRVDIHVLSHGDVISVGRFRIIVELHSDDRQSYHQILRSKDPNEDEQTLRGPA